MYISEGKEDLNQQTEYRTDEKYYKQLKNFDNVKGLVTLKESEEFLLQHNISKRILKSNNGKELEVFEFGFPEGFIVIKNYLSLETQIELATVALNEFTGKINSKAT